MLYTFSSQVEVEFMDEGDYDVVPISALREFPEHLKELKTLPNQVGIYKMCFHSNHFQITCTLYGFIYWLKGLAQSC